MMGFWLPSKEQRTKKGTFPHDAGIFLYGKPFAADDATAMAGLI